jgi:hypothetical protein
VDHVLITRYRMSTTGLSTSLRAERQHKSPNSTVQGTGLPFAGAALLLTDVVADAVALPGSPPRGAPV